MARPTRSAVHRSVAQALDSLQRRSAAIRRSVCRAPQGLTPVKDSHPLERYHPGMCTSDTAPPAGASREPEADIMSIVRVQELPYATTAWGVKGRKIIDLPEIGIVNLWLEAGEVVPSHKTPVDVLFQVIAGSGTVTVGEESHAVNAGDFVESPKGVPHALAADQEEAFSVYVMKIPNMQKGAVHD